jgi:DNA helicase II / ATP-dependent DNA helicase PcrA
MTQEHGVAREYLLNFDQTRAIESSSRALVVFASAGSGKTEVASRRIERLLVQDEPDYSRILALSYTVKAADELRDRLRTRLGDAFRRVEAETVHGFAHSLLRAHGTRIGLPVEPEVIARDVDRAELLTDWYQQSGRQALQDPLSELREIDLARARLESTPEVANWDAALRGAGVLDFGAMLSRAMELLELPSMPRQMAQIYSHVVVDEAQNLTPEQYKMITSLIGEPGVEFISTMLVGDDKQSIVSFAGADSSLMHQFETQYGAERIVLRTNYRSALRIVELGNRVASELLDEVDIGAHLQASYAATGMIRVEVADDEGAEASRVSHWIVGLLTSGIPQEASADGEDSHVSPSEIAVLSRSSAWLLRIRDLLTDSEIPWAMQVSPDDWLSSLAGKLAYEIVCIRSAAAHRSAYWQAARLLGVPVTNVKSIEDLVTLLGEHADPLVRSLISLMDVESPEHLVRVLRSADSFDAVDDMSIIEWDSDRNQLLDAWESFISITAIAEQTWINFRLFVSRLQRGESLDNGVRLLTIHKAQGREFRAVAVIGMNDGQFPDFRATTGSARRAELRTFYVAVTRPSRALLLTRARYRSTRYGPRTTQPSPYLELVTT